LAFDSAITAGLGKSSNFLRGARNAPDKVARGQNARIPHSPVWLKEVFFDGSERRLHAGHGVMFSDK
jgi:hypothetical protein